MNVCPTEIELQRWLAGDLSEAESQTIETHVEGCTQICQPLIDGFSGFEDGRSVSVSLASQAGGTPAPQTEAGETPAPQTEAGETPAPQTEAGETPAPQPADFPKLPGYDMLGQLGRGGMGVVYKARHRRMDRFVAIKVLPPCLIDDAAVVARFEREVRAAARLHHPHIVAAYDAAEAGGVHFLVMEYVEGMDLAARVRRQGPLAVEQAVDCVLQAARGLDYAHRHGVVHRDIKPSNLLVDREGVVKVLDMGLARFESSLGGEQTDLTSMGQIMGTVDYMAPEQALDTHRADARSDIYSLGMTLWYLLTGRPAYAGENALARLLAHREQPIPSLRSACPGATPELEAVFSKMAAKQPEDRYQTMAEVVAALEDGLPRPSSISAGQASDVGWDQRACERRPTITDTLNAHPDVAVQTAPANAVASPATEATVTLQSVEVDTDPNTEQSLDLLAGALPRPPRPPRRKLPIAAALAGLAAVAAAAAFVVRVETDTGEVVIESEVDDISVDIVRDGQPVKEDWQIHAGDGNRWVVRSGIINVRLPANLDGQFSLDQDTARLIRDGKIIVRITRKRNGGMPAIGQAFQPDGAARPVSPTDVSPDRDRAAAEWVLAQGGTVQIDQKSGPMWITSPSELPPSPFELRHAGLWGIKSVGSGDLGRFVGLSHLDSLLLTSTDIAADAMPHILKIPSLSYLYLGDTAVRSSDLAALAPMPRLANIWVGSPSQIDDGWAGLVPLASLRQLVVPGEIGADNFRSLNKLTQLRMIWLHSAAEVNQDTVTELQRANPLCRVLVGYEFPKALGRDPVAELAKTLFDKGAEFDARLISPKQGDPKATEENLAAAKPVHIGNITLPDGASLNDEELRLLDAPALLAWFGAGKSKGADRYAAALANQTYLRGVGLWQSDLTDAGLEHLKHLPALTSLDVGGTKVTRAGVEAFKKQRPDCTIKWIAPTAPPSPAEDRERAAAEWVLAQGGTIRCLTADGKSVEAKTGAELPAGQFQIHNVNLWGCASVTSADLDRFVGLPRLTRLLVARTQVDGDAIPQIQKIPHLTLLHLTLTGVRSSDLVGLAPLRGLHLLWLDPQTQNDDAWAGLAALSGLRILLLSSNASADDIRQLGKLSQLRTVRLVDSPDVEDAVAELQAANPLCRVVVGDDSVLRAIGRDNVAELAKRLLSKGAQVGISTLDGGPAKPINDELAAGRPVFVGNITLPVGVSLDEEELRLLDALDGLRWFKADNCQGADRHAAALAKQSALVGINFSQSDLTDAGLEQLKQLPALSDLYIRGTKVTSAGVAALRKALPDCKIDWQPSEAPTSAP